MDCCLFFKQKKREKEKEKRFLLALLVLRVQCKLPCSDAVGDGREER